jgi:dTDP-4-amino-4,6-dideoxygalactose transaminase
MRVPFNKPHYPVKSLLAILRSAYSGTISGNGKYTRLCQDFFERTYGFRKTLMTTSCTDALEMAALLAGIRTGDEVIMPSFTFVSTANAFLLRGAVIRFADTLGEIPNIDPEAARNLITPKTRAIVVVHYSGIACDMDPILKLASDHNLVVVEDAAHSLDSYYKGKALGSLGHFGTFSFHETKNIFCGEGGLLTVNDDRFIPGAEIAWEKGTNRAAFFRGEIDRYGWVSIGSSYLPSDALASFLYTQLEILDRIQDKRKKIWNWYHEVLKPLEEKGVVRRPVIPDYATVNGNMYYLVTSGQDERDRLIAHLKKNGIAAIFHYPPLHSSTYFKPLHDGRELPNTDRFSGSIIRLPFFYALKKSQVLKIAETIREFYTRYPIFDFRYKI